MTLETPRTGRGRRGRGRRRLAAVDIGTNSVRLLLAEIAPRGRLVTVLRQGAVTRLGEGLAASGLIAERAARRTGDVARAFATEAELRGAEDVYVTGTSALRTATNGPEIAEALGRTIGRPVRVLSGEEEARLVFRAVGAGLPGPRAVIDVGGGSTEVIRSTAAGVVEARSLPLGAVVLTERFVAAELPGDADRAALEEFLRRELAEKLEGVSLEPGTRLYGVGGTVTALAATDKQLEKYDPALIEGHVLSQARVETLADLLWRTPLAERRAIPGVSAGRADIVLAGSVLLLAALRHLAAPALAVSTRGLRYGVLLEALEGRPRGRPPAPRPRPARGRPVGGQGA